MDEEIKKDDVELEKGDEKLQECQKKSNEYLNNWKRSAADFINYKKEEMERTAMLINYTKEDMIDKILPILDNFYLAAKQMPEDVGKSVWGGGFLQIVKQVEEFLKKEGIEEIKVVGEKFNPNFHEVIEEVGPAEASAKGGETGIIVEEVQKGYTSNGKVLRPAKVRVTK